MNTRQYQEFLNQHYRVKEHIDEIHEALNLFSAEPKFLRYGSSITDFEDSWEQQRKIGLRIEYAIELLERFGDETIRDEIEQVLSSKLLPLLEIENEKLSQTTKIIAKWQLPMKEE